LKALTKFFIVTSILYAFSCSTGAVKAQDKSMHLSPYAPKWDTDPAVLSFAGDQQAMSLFAMELSQRYASQGQKIFAYKMALLAHSLDKKNRPVSLVLAKTAFIAADQLEDESEMQKIAEKGLEAALLADSSVDPIAAYYHALNLGLIIKIKGILALGKLPELVKALELARKNPGIDSGGSLRVLGMLYLKAPSWPQGIGDLDKSIEILEESVSKYPAHPQNQMFYAEAMIESESYDKALAAAEKAYNLAIPEIWGQDYSKKWRMEIEVIRAKIKKKMN
jgi:tetratricopeptide (TPR) repeat protein